ncbi:WD repeat domain phosphoinositide-interacting protein 2 [Culex quinquefasciatus]|uniref:WD repeat domain phosphoinositide-interacting protein 2 n=1 Tax=Culex quinquefasciatus TaxID=7176 RepID=B0WDX0_CULQU|nr:WD repeat domain phosphoinositide-interacting protein 2 [Culex quinquefasciatus]|eukprot:XP_001846904.1 WD repeat domain phosphoinositide-interacting protein 2 [Culex quinquefasciatus]
MAITEGDFNERSTCTHRCVADSSIRGHVGELDLFQLEFLVVYLEAMHVKQQVGIDEYNSIHQFIQLGSSQRKESQTKFTQLVRADIHHVYVRWCTRSGTRRRSRRDCSHSTVGAVPIIDAVNLHGKTTTPVHDSPLAVIAFSQMGTEVAAASEKGTVIRVFSVNDSSKQFELRRDFALERTSPESGNETMGGKNDHWMRYISKTVLSYLPEADS